MTCGGTGKWSRVGVPHKGWSELRVIDVGNDLETCEMCEVAQVRYVHVVEHPWWGVLRVGVDCAGVMTGDYVGARARDLVSRKGRGWLDRKWRVSVKGSEFLNARGWIVVVWPKRDGGWGARILNRETNQVIKSNLWHGTSEDAKLACLQVIETLEAKKARAGMEEIMKRAMERWRLTG
jgi:hypothetical protein